MKVTDDMDWLAGDQVRKLLSRLEAAERVCEEVEYFQADLEEDEYGALLGAYDTWREAKGRHG